jgi:F-type H+-transporting ATPase subunit a
VAGQHTYLSFPLSSFYNDPSWAAILPDIERFALAVGVGGLLVFGGAKIVSRVTSPEGVKKAVIPDSKLGTFSLLEAAVEAVAKFYDSVLGDPGRKHLPFVFSVFFFILLLNLLGLFPGMPSATNTVWLNVGIALVVFGYFNAVGIKEQGLGGYLKHFCGPILLLAPFMFVLEIFSICLRVLTLNLRLYWNIKADHEVVSVFTDLLPPGFPVIFYVLGTFVSFMQAFIFSTLTMVYILLASHHEEEHAH